MFESKGIKRALGIILMIASNVPQLAPYQQLLMTIGGLFGVSGLVHAAVSQLRAR